MILTPHERRALVFSGAVFILGLFLHILLKLFPASYQCLTFLDHPPGHFRIDVNRASYDELLGVPGIGPAVAARIIYAREARGRFTALDELHGIKGFSKKSMQRADPHLLVGAP